MENREQPKNKNRRLLGLDGNVTFPFGLRPRSHSDYVTFPWRRPVRRLTWLIPM